MLKYMQKNQSKQADGNSGKPYPKPANLSQTKPKGTQLSQQTITKQIAAIKKIGEDQSKKPGVSLVRQEVINSQNLQTKTTQQQNSKEPQKRQSSTLMRINPEQMRI